MNMRRRSCCGRAFREIQRIQHRPAQWQSDLLRLPTTDNVSISHRDPESTANVVAASAALWMANSGGGLCSQRHLEDFVSLTKSFLLTKSQVFGLFNL